MGYMDQNPTYSAWSNFQPTSQPTYQSNFMPNPQFQQMPMSQQSGGGAKWGGFTNAQQQQAFNPTTAQQIPRANQGQPLAALPAIQGVNTAQQSAAAFGQAKDQAAQTSDAALRGLQQQLAARGMSGGGYEAGQTVNTLSQGANQIGQASRAQAQYEAELAQRTAEFNAQQQLAERGQNLAQQLGGLQADVTQRGQDVGLTEANQAQAIQRLQGIDTTNLAATEDQYQGNIAQRGQDIGATQDMNQNQLALAGLQDQMAQANLGAAVGQRGQNIQSEESANSLNNQTNLANFQGQIGQRGQSMQQQNANNQLNYNYWSKMVDAAMRGLNVNGPTGGVVGG